MTKIMDDKNDEIEHLRKKLKHAEERLIRLERYNEELRNELKLMTEKFLLSKQLDQQQQLTTNDDEKKFNQIIKKEELEEIKALSEKFSDYYYDSKSKTYFSRSTGWYYYQESDTFYNPNDTRYYKYDQSKKEYIFICNLDGSTTTTTEKSDSKNRKNKKSSDKDGEKEDGEINDDDDENDDVCDDECIDISSDSDHDNDNQHKNIDFKSKKSSLHYDLNTLNRTFSKNFNKIPPCRLIVKRSESLENDSILMISCMGGKIGQHSNCTVTIPDKTVSQIHAEINYDHSRRIYMIQDLISKNGTFVNGKRLAQLERTPLCHLDEIILADCCQLIVHIHTNRDDDCEECDGSITIFQQQKQDSGIYTNYQAKSSRSAMKSLKRKYGLENGMDTESNDEEKRSKYRDRANERQRTIGSDCPYEKTAAGSALDFPINDQNKGYQMLERMGWKSGQSLGREKSEQNCSKHLIEPIEIVDEQYTNERRGLGYGS